MIPEGRKMRKLSTAAVLFLCFILQGCAALSMKVSVEVSPVQSRCLKQIVYILPEPGSGLDQYTYGQLMAKNSALESGLKTYPDCCRFFNLARASQESSDIKNPLSIAAYAAGAILFFLPVFDNVMNKDTKTILTWSGAGLAACGIVIRVMGIMDNRDARENLKKSIDAYNRHCY